MEKRTDFYDFIDKIQRQDKYIEHIEQENNNLKNELMEDMKTETKLNEKIKKLKSDLAYERTMLDNVKAEYENLQEINKKLKEKIEKLEKELSAVYKAYHTAMWVDLELEEDLYTIEDIEWNNVE